MNTWLHWPIAEVLRIPATRGGQSTDLAAAPILWGG